MTHESTDRQPRSVTEPDRPSDIDRMDDQLRNDIQPEQDIQPEESSPRSANEKQIRSQSDRGSQRVAQNASDHVGEAGEEA